MWLSFAKPAPIPQRKYPFAFAKAIVITMNYKMIIYTLGWILLFEAAFLLVPAVIALIYLETLALWAFLATVGICLAAGKLFSLKRPKNTTLRARDGFVIVALSWIVLSIFGALPFMFTGVTHNFIDALFETASGFTTTGATIFSDVEILPRSIIMWRSVTHWVGGMGVLVFVMAFLPLSGGQNLHLMKAESTGATVSKAAPKIRTTAIMLYTMYIALTFAQVIFLVCGDMNFFYAINTAFSTAGTGGFGFLNSSMGSFSAYSQIVVTVFMLLFSINFGSYFLILRGKIKESLTGEVKTFVLIVVAAIALITVNIHSMFGSVGEALRHASFTVASLISTTGFSTVDFDLWPAFSETILVILMFIGACAGSTGGGIKVSRIIVMFKLMGRELATAIRPKQIKKISVDGQVQETGVVRSIYGYIFCFIAVFFGSLLLISLDGSDFTTNFTAVTSAVGNIGPGLSKVGPTMNFSFFSPLSKLVLTFDMLAGRLEFFPMLLLFSPSTWKK